MTTSPNKQDMARFHAGGVFQLAYIPGPDDRLQKELSLDYCQSSPAAPFANGNQGPMYGRAVIPAPSYVPRPPHSYVKPYQTNANAPALVPSIDRPLGNPPHGSICYSPSY